MPLSQPHASLRSRAILVFARRQASTWRSSWRSVHLGQLARDHRYTKAADQNGSRRRPWRGWKRERPVSNPARGFPENGKSHEKTKYELDKVRLDDGSPSWIRIEPCVSLPTHHLGACWR